MCLRGAWTLQWLEVWAPTQNSGSFWKLELLGAAWQQVWGCWMWLVCVPCSLLWFLLYSWEQLLPGAVLAPGADSCVSRHCSVSSSQHFCLISSAPLWICSELGLAGPMLHSREVLSPSIQNILQNEAKDSEVGRGVRRALLVWHIFNP